MTDFVAAMHSAFGAERLRSHVPLAAFTTFRVGGPADWLLETRTSDEIVTALKLARSANLPVTMLGGGSNVLVADAGVRGLVIRTRGGGVCAMDEAHVRADAAVTINGLVRWTINHRLGGLEAWAGTPGTVGGAIFGNAHFAGRLIGDLVTEVRLAGPDGAVADAPAPAMAFGYDRSRLQDTGEILLSAVFRVSAGEAAALRAIARASLAFRKRTQPLDTPSAGCIFQNPDPGRDLVTEVRLAGPDGAVADAPAPAMAFGYDRSRLQDTGEILLSAVFRVSAGEAAALRAIARASLAFRKRTQPLDTPSAGCIFQNPDPGRDPVPDGLPWSAGALVDRAGMKGAALAGARVSTTHGNFIVNEGDATAAAIRRLIDQCRTAVRDRFGVELREEIVYLGAFDEERVREM
ncbi:MAG: hypothetical protein DMF95_21090 [Acidobacteria bacterium]|nr:MAG: hypothetical protein DMF95_21090 [Acidobacteriota bacterium]